MASSESETIQDFRDYAEDVANSSYSVIENNLRRFISLFETGEPLGDLAAQLLPEVDFDTWYEKGLASGGSMVGSRRLDWPIGRREKVALQLELLRRIASGGIQLHGFFSGFCWVANDFNLNTAKFLSEIFQPFCRDFVRTVQAALPKEESEATSPPPTSTPNLIDDSRLDELRALPNTTFDFSRLIRLCEELNITYRNHAYHAVAALTRALLDHVPPLFGFSTFSEVANNYGGARSFREAMDHLNSAARKIGDAHLHTQIRLSEVLPNATQVNFSNALDVLLAEIVRISR